MCSIIKWGIVGCGRISHDFCSAMNIISHGHKISAVAARDASRAQQFARIHQIDKCYGNYEQLAKDRNVDIVYVGSIHPTHYDITKMMLTHDKHVLCEKPMTLSHEHTAQVIDLAKQCGLFLMEGIWSRCTPAYEQLRHELRAETIGKIHALLATFCVPIIYNERTYRKELGGSIVLDTGIYLLQLASLVFGRQPCRRVFTGHSLPSGVDDYVGLTLQYNGGAQVAHMYCDGRYGASRNDAVIYGERGSITICDPFWSPLELIVSLGERERHVYPLPGADLVSERLGMNYIHSENLVHEIEHVGQCLTRGRLESDLVPHADSLHMAQLMDEARRAAGAL